MRDEEKIILGIMLLAIPVFYVQMRGDDKVAAAPSDQPPRPPPPTKPIEPGGEAMQEDLPDQPPPTHGDQSRGPTQGFPPGGGGAGS